MLSVDHAHTARNLIVGAALAYALSALALVFAEHPPACLWTKANTEHYAAGRYWSEQDFLRAERSDVLAASFVLGCKTPAASVFSAAALAQAAGAYTRWQYERIASLVDGERASLRPLAIAYVRSAENLNPYALLYRPIIEALDRLSHSIALDGSRARSKLIA